MLNALETNWDLGETEGGSSGAGVFFERGPHQGELVGVLAGGQNTCGTHTTFGDIVAPFRDFYPQISWWIGVDDSYEPEPKTHMLHAVLGAGGDLQSFIRIRNEGTRAGEVEIYAIEDAGNRYGPVTLRLGGWQTRHFNSEDLEHGNASKGIIGGVGDGIGMWRLELTTSLPIAARAYIRTPDRFVTSMHQVAKKLKVLEYHGYHYYWVPIFNPASNTAIRSVLRVINPNPYTVSVEIVGLDDDRQQMCQRDGQDEYCGGFVEFLLAANSAMQISAQALEQGDAAFSGSLGAGSGKWALQVSSTNWPIHVMSLLSTPSGHLTNLSR